MSRAKAVEAAWERMQSKWALGGDARAELERLADEMRIAGLREAARVKHSNRDYDSRFSESKAWDAGHDAHAEAIRARARELARKSKGGRG